MQIYLSYDFHRNHTKGTLEIFERNIRMYLEMTTLEVVFKYYLAFFNENRFTSYLLLGKSLRIELEKI
jgi:hypothetical protein